MADRTLTDGSPVYEGHDKLKPNGQQEAYVVLSEVERAKGFVRPVRFSYVHVGKRPRYPLRDLTEDELRTYGSERFVKYEVYPESKRPKVGRFWTERELNSGCGATTTMAASIAETYARQPTFYGGTFCCCCGKHYPVGADGEFVWSGTNERVGT